MGFNYANPNIYHFFKLCLNISYHVVQTLIFCYSSQTAKTKNPYGRNFLFINWTILQGCNPFLVKTKNDNLNKRVALFNEGQYNK